jgi:hypothetical protein
MQLLKYGQSEYVRDFGLSINPEDLPRELDARVINPPELDFGVANVGSNRFMVYPVAVLTDLY